MILMFSSDFQTIIKRDFMTGHETNDFQGSISVSGIGFLELNVVGVKPHPYGGLATLNKGTTRVG